MSSYYNFLYDPSRQGYDSSVWRTAYGSPGVQSGQLVLQQAAAIHYGDCVKGDYTFEVNVPNSPEGGESRRWGLYSPNRGAYAWFSIEGEQLLAQVSDGTTSSETAITWSSAWTGVDTQFRIIWEAGLVHFYVGSNEQATLSGDGVPRTPLALYLSNANVDYMTVGYITARGLQSFYMNIDLDDTVFAGGDAFVAELVTITENVSKVLSLQLSTVIDTGTVTESVTQQLLLLLPAVAETVSVAEDVVNDFTLLPTVSAEAITVAEDVTAVVTESTAVVSDSVGVEDIVTGTTLA